MITEAKLSQNIAPNLNPGDTSCSSDTEAAPPLSDQMLTPSEFSQLAVQHRPILEAVARRNGLSPEDARDASQEALAKAWVARKSFAPGTNFMGWSARIVQNVTKDTHRRQARHPEDSVSPLDLFSDFTRKGRMSFGQTEAQSPDQTAEISERRSKMTSIIDGLPAPFRETLALWVMGVPQSEIAERLGVKQGTVKSRVNRGITMASNNSEIEELKVLVGYEV